jgi:PhzF family phenazine biosynthesis protein
MTQGAKQDIEIYQVDAFSDTVFGGNPAAICPMTGWLPDRQLQAIAAENNLSETAFFLPEGDGYRLRWFTPKKEVDLCGHATLATAHVLKSLLTPDAESFSFQTRSGLLTVHCTDDGYAMDFPAIRGEAAPEKLAALTEALGAAPLEALQAMDTLALFTSEAEIWDLTPDMAKLAAIDTRGVIATAPGEAVDFVSRFFAPQSGIPEDPVTGSAHSMLTPFWAERLGKSKLTARQISARGGALSLEERGERVTISGQAVLYMQGRIRV